MPEAVVDLPDPTSPPPPVENADELLSQLAGEQIDRLLSSESEPAPLATSLPHAETPTDPPVAVPLPTAPATQAEAAATLETPHEVAKPLETHPAVEASDGGFLVRILTILNAPFAAVPPEVRDVLGKLGILLLINAIGFILFAVLTKRH